MMEWWNDEMVEWLNCGMVEWWNDKWWKDGMMEWLNDGIIEVLNRQREKIIEIWDNIDTFFGKVEGVGWWMLSLGTYKAKNLWATTFKRIPFFIIPKLVNWILFKPMYPLGTTLVNMPPRLFTNIDSVKSDKVRGNIEECMMQNSS